MEKKDNKPASAITKFLWWVATAHIPILKNCPTAHTRMSIVGTIVLVTSFVAFFSGLYFFQVLTNNLFYSAILGIFFAFIIFSLDRLLIASVNKEVDLSTDTGFVPKENGKNNPIFSSIGVKSFSFRFLFLRLFISLIIGLLYAEPLILKFFDTEIEDQVSINKVEYLKVRMSRESRLDSIQQGPIKLKINSILSERNTLKSDRDSAYTQFKNEMDGSYNSSGKVGYAKIAKQKEARYNEMKAKYDSLVLKTQPELENLNGILVQLVEKNKNLQFSEAERLKTKSSGYLDKETALWDLMAGNPSVVFKYILFLLFFMLIDIAPLLTKLWFKVGSYEMLMAIETEKEYESVLRSSRVTKFRAQIDEKKEFSEIESS
jgi:phosphate/sulfate permease